MAASPPAVVSRRFLEDCPKEVPGEDRSRSGVKFPPRTRKRHPFGCEERQHWRAGVPPVRVLPFCRPYRTSTWQGRGLPPSWHMKRSNGLQAKLTKPAVFPVDRNRCILQHGNFASGRRRSLPEHWEYDHTLARWPCSPVYSHRSNTVCLGVHASRAWTSSLSACRRCRGWHGCYSWRACPPQTLITRAAPYHMQRLPENHPTVVG
jgi:hypothetical protein